MRVVDLMQKGVVSVSPELPVAELEDFFASEEVSGAPVVDNESRLVGIVSQSDIVRALSDEPSVDLKELLAPDLLVENIMTPSVLTVTPSDDVRDVAKRLLEARVHRALVVEGDALLGIVTSTDLLRAIL